ncbi:MAG: hypothetical protein KF849_16575 [Rhizobiaceae bacterium]|nr:hypothetical protein [Rhizobiaceae bacterium]
MSFLISLLTGEAADAAARARRSAIEYLLAGSAAVCGFVFLMIAAFAFISDNLRYGPLKTALAFAAFFLALAVVMLVYHRVRATARARRAREKRQADMKAALSGALIAALPSMLSRRGGIAGVILPAVAAFAFAIYRENTRPKDDGKGD